MCLLTGDDAASNTPSSADLCMWSLSVCLFLRACVCISWQNLCATAATVIVRHRCHRRRCRCRRRRCPLPAAHARAHAHTGVLSCFHNHCSPDMVETRAAETPCPFVSCLCFKLTCCL
eukprot:m.127899 g.127899  ORF g.127899 m.127899 type:complete len:118 (+) comp9738_c0_seq2:1219-1572(+)